MENNLIQIEKGKYTALLRRILGMQVSENGVSELSAISKAIRDFGIDLKPWIDREMYERNLESIEFAIELYKLQKENLWPTTVEEIDFSNYKEEEDCEDCC